MEQFESVPGFDQNTPTKKGTPEIIREGGSTPPVGTIYFNMSNLKPKVMNKDEITRFKTFLTSHRLYAKFVRNLKKQNKGQTFIKHCKEVNDPQDVILTAFTWTNTPEDYDFWVDTEILYLKECKS